MNYVTINPGFSRVPIGVMKGHGGRVGVRISAPDGAYPGAPLIATGGVPVVYTTGEFGVIPGAVEGAALELYRFVINGVPTGDWFVSPGEIPGTVIDGDLIQVMDASGAFSNSLMGMDFSNWTSGVNQWTSSSSNWVTTNN